MIFYFRKKLKYKHGFTVGFYREFYFFGQLMLLCLIFPSGIYNLYSNFFGNSCLSQDKIFDLITTGVKVDEMCIQTFFNRTTLPNNLTNRDMDLEYILDLITLVLMIIVINFYRFRLETQLKKFENNKFRYCDFAVWIKNIKGKTDEDTILQAIRNYDKELNPVKVVGNGEARIVVFKEIYHQQLLLKQENRLIQQLQKSFCCTCCGNLLKINDVVVDVFSADQPFDIYWDNQVVEWIFLKRLMLNFLFLILLFIGCLLFNYLTAKQDSHSEFRIHLYWDGTIDYVDSTSTLSGIFQYLISGILILIEKGIFLLNRLTTIFEAYPTKSEGTSSILQKEIITSLFIQILTNLLTNVASESDNTRIQQNIYKNTGMISYLQSNTNMAIISQVLYPLFIELLFKQWKSSYDCLELYSFTLSMIFIAAFSNILDPLIPICVFLLLEIVHFCIDAEIERKPFDYQKSQKETIPRQSLELARFILPIFSLSNLFFRYIFQLDSIQSLPFLGLVLCCLIVLFPYPLYEFFQLFMGKQQQDIKEANLPEDQVPGYSKTQNESVEEYRIHQQNGDSYDLF